MRQRIRREARVERDEPHATLRRSHRIEREVTMQTRSVRTRFVRRHIVEGIRDVERVEPRDGRTTPAMIRQYFRKGR